MSRLFVTGVPQGLGLGVVRQISEIDDWTIVTTYLDPACTRHSQSSADHSDDLNENFEFLVGNFSIIDETGRKLSGKDCFD